MTRLQTLKPRIATLDTRRIKPMAVADVRITGRRLQDRRFNAWKKSPYCACCGIPVQYPDGFELDHKVPLHKGGPDTSENTQILCAYVDELGIKHGCHVAKTAQDVR